MTAAFNKTEFLNLLTRLALTPGPTGRERPRALALKAWLSGGGWRRVLIAPGTSG